MIHILHGADETGVATLLADDKDVVEVDPLLVCSFLIDKGCLNSNEDLSLQLEELLESDWFK